MFDKRDMTSIFTSVYLDKANFLEYILLIIKNINQSNN
jgi:hypothetical protein